MKPVFNDAVLGREDLELKVLAPVIDKDAERGNYFPKFDLKRALPWGVKL